MKVGTIERLRRALSSGKLDSQHLAQFFLNRIKSDASAAERGLPISGLSLPTTNSVVGFSDGRTLAISRGCLSGIPFLAKDNYCIKSSNPTTCASRALLNYSAPYNASVSCCHTLTNLMLVLLRYRLFRLC